MEPARITIIGEKISDTKARGGNAKKNKKVQGGEFIICTRYKVSSFSTLDDESEGSTFLSRIIVVILS